MKSKKKNQRKWESNHYQQSEDYVPTKKEKEFLSKYRSIAGEYLEDWEFIELFKKNNFDEEQISKELNKIILGDDFKWKEIKNGKPVTTRSTDQVRKKQRYYKTEKNYNNAYDKNDEDRNESNNKRKIKGSYHKNLNDFYHYVNKRPKRPFQKCIEVPSDYLPMKNNNNNNYNNVQDNKNVINTDNNDNNNHNNNLDNNFSSNNKIIPSKSANNIIKIDKNTNKIINEIQQSNDNKKAIIKPLPVNMNKIEETKNEENEKITSEEEQRRIILIKGEVFKNLKRLKTNTETKLKDNKNRQKEKYKEKDSSEKRIKTSGGVDSDYSLSNQDIKNDKALQKKYLRIFFGNMNHYSKKVENNIKRATSKDSETSDDRPETVKRNKRNNIPMSSNVIQKKSRAVNINNNKINKNLRRAYELEREGEMECESKVVNITINSCYDNPYRDQYLKFINEKRKKNPGKIVELIIPQFNNMYMPPYPLPYQYPYLNQNMYMYPPAQYQTPMPVPNQPNITNQNNTQQIPQYQSYGINIPREELNQQYQPQMNMPFNPYVNPQINLQMSPQVNNSNKYMGNNNINNPELLSPKSNKEINSDNQINNMSDN